MITIYGEQARPYCQNVILMVNAVGLVYTNTEAMNDKDRAFVATVSPNGTTPVILDSDNGVSVSESNAILLYLADKTGKLLPGQGQARADGYQWLLFESTALSASINELYHYLCAAPMDIPYALDRGRKRVLRCMEIVDKRLAERDFLCGEVSIADIAIRPWTSVVEEFTDVSLATFSHVMTWSRRMDALP